MLENYSKKVVTAGLMVALGIILPFVTAHGFGMPGNILLPMHIPVLLCGFFCGPLFGALCGLILPPLNSILTGMPVLYPMAIIMACELAGYGLISGLVYKATNYSNKLPAIVISLVSAMTAGRILYGISAAILLHFDGDAGKFSVIAAVITGIPGIIVQLILIPGIILFMRKHKIVLYNAQEEAIKLVRTGKATCVLVKDNKIISADSPRGIAYIIDLYEKNKLENVFVADKIVGKAASMIFTTGKIKACYGENVSKNAIAWMESQGIEMRYTHVSDYIMNRTNDGMCPMEQTVENIDNPQEAIIALKNKIAELRNK